MLYQLTNDAYYINDDFDDFDDLDDLDDGPGPGEADVGDLYDVGADDVPAWDIPW